MSLAGYPPKETPHSCRFTSMVFSGSCTSSSYAEHHLLCLLLTQVTFSSLARISGEGLTRHFPPTLFCFVLSGDQLAHTIPLFERQGQSPLAQRAETTAAEGYLTSCVLTRFP